MKLFLVDYHLEAGRTCEAEGKKQDAEGHFLKAGKMIADATHFLKNLRTKG
jgi:hypothetical protein